MPAVYGLVAIVLVVAVVAVAYGTQAPSLGVAEFSPAARQQVEASPTTAADPGSAGAGGARRSTTSTTTPPTASTDAASAAQAAPTTRVPRSRTCVGNPPRQTEDPQAPPCVAAIFEGDNGGATTNGVTATEIAVAVPNRTGAGQNDTIRLLFDYFNRRYELYGRRLVPVFVTYNVGTPMAARATGDEIAARNVFAALDTIVDLLAPSPTLHQAIAHKGVISIVGRDIPYADRSLFDEWHPYIWSVHPSAEQIWQATAELACTALKGRTASHAGTALRNTTRKFGVVVTRDPSTAVAGSGELVSAMQGCGADPVVVQVTTMWDANQVRTALTALQSAGVTTTICACNAGATRMPSSMSSVAGWEPELLLPTFMYNIEAIERDLQEPAVAAAASRTFGVHQQAKALPFQARPFFGAMLEVSPSFTRANPTSSDYNFFEYEGTYRQLALLAAGIQGAGPSLTADAFGQALMSMQFPNPGAGQAPFWQSPVGFGPGDHAMNNGVALAWWNPTIPTTSVLSASGRLGSWCFLGGGTRFGPGEMPADADARFFNPSEPCR